MIRLKKKIIKLRNPGWELDENEKPDDFIPPRTVSKELLDCINKVFKHGNYIGGSVSYTRSVRYLENLVTLWNGGSYCFDCSDHKDPDNPTPFELCRCEQLDLDSEEATKITWEFAKMVLSYIQLRKLRNNIRKNRIGDYYFSNEVLDNDNSKPSYPKYKKIAEELFRL